MNNLLTFASETLILIAFMIGYRLGKNGQVLTEGEKTAILKIGRPKTKILKPKEQKD
jgi:hypothetical protein